MDSSPPKRLDVVFVWRPGFNVVNFTVEIGTSLLVVRFYFFAAFGEIADSSLD